MLQANVRRPASAHVVVLGNEKGGAGKSTIAMHIAVALLNFGQRVATIDLDLRQKSLNLLYRQPARLGQALGAKLALPEHACVARGTTQKLDENEAIEFTSFVDALTAVEQTHDFIVIDTAGTDNHLTRLAHSMANTLITPLNDSFVDFNVLGMVDPEATPSSARAITRGMVREARTQRRLADGAQMDWVLVRNRVSVLDSRNKQRIGKGIGELAVRLGFRVAEPLGDRVIYREFFPRGHHRARPARREDARHAPYPLPRHRAQRDHDADGDAETAARRARRASARRRRRNGRRYAENRSICMT